MIGRGIVGLAVVVYLVVLGCVLIPSDAPAKKVAAEESTAAPADVSPDEAIDANDTAAPSNAPVGLPYKGAAMQIQRVDWIDKYEKSMDEIAAVGCDTVSLVLDTRQEKASSAHIYLDMRMSPTPEKLGELIQHAKSKGLRVILMPVVLLDAPENNDWRGVIEPTWNSEPAWDKWFESYQAVLTHFAWIAERYHADVLSVGSELVSSESHKAEWIKTIHHVRGIFHGQLTYSANWDHYQSVPFWKELDLIGMNSYYKLGENHDVKVEEIVSRWKDIQKDLLKFQKKIGKPILFLEIGWCSLANAADEPWDYTRTELAVDMDLQRRLYEGFFEAWYKVPGLGGFVVWEWPPGDGGKATREQYTNDDDYTAAIKGYTPENKPAEKVLRDWLAKPWR